MNPVKKISYPDWIPDEAKDILKTLNEAKNNSALFVGGCVRNTLLNECKTDIDIATKFKPEEVIKILSNDGVKVIPTGIKHGTVTAVKNKISVEITTLRDDIETDGRHAVVEFSNDWKKDALRRDFTMNALYMDAEGNVFDPTEQGLVDCIARHVRFVGDAEKRIKEDYLRILRFFRFHAQYGKDEVSKKDIQICKKNAEGIKALSRERITQEFLKLIRADRAPKVLEAMFHANILEKIKGKNYQASFLNNLIHLQNKYHDIVEKDSIVMTRYFILSGGKATFHDDVLNFSNAQANFIIKLDAIAHKSIFESEKTIKKAMILHGRAIVFQGYLLLLAQEKIEKQSSVFDMITKWDIPICPVTGEALIKEGYKTSPELGRELERRKEEWLDTIL